MQILITGGTGLIGRNLCKRWVAQGHTVYVWSRSPDKVKSLCGESVRGIKNLTEIDGIPFEAVVNLAGAPIADKPWTTARRQLLRSSRIALTAQLISWLAKQEHKPEVLISGSAVGWYGNGGNAPLTEDSPPQSQDFATELCADWESAALAAGALGIRVALIRTGLVLTGQGGFLSRLTPLFKLGLGGKQGTGEQWMPWVHLDDEVGIIDFVLQHPECSGPYNACAPNPVRNQDFAKILGGHLNRPAILPVPGFMLKMILGDMAELLLGGQKLQPKRIIEAGYRFKYESLEGALKAL